MANFNKGEYIDQAIESVLSQTISDWELLIYDDGSTDNSVFKVKKYLNDPRIIYIESESNKGKVNALKEMLARSSSDKIAILDSDDFLEKSALEKVVKIFNKRPEYGFAYSQFAYCDSRSNILGPGFASKMKRGDSNILKPYTLALRAYRKEVYLKTSGYDKKIEYSEDYDILLKLEEVTPFYFIDEILYYYRRIPKSNTSDHFKREISRVSSIIAKYNAFERRKGTKLPNLSRRKMSSELMLAILPLIKIKKINMARKYLILALKISPFNVFGLLLVVFRIIKFPFYKIFRIFFPNYIENPIQK